MRVSKKVRERRNWEASFTSTEEKLEEQNTRKVNSKKLRFFGMLIEGIKPSKSCVKSFDFAKRHGRQGRGDVPRSSIGSKP